MNRRLLNIMKKIISILTGKDRAELDREQVDKAGDILSSIGEGVIEGKPGANIMGTIQAESGIGQAVRSLILPIERMGIPYELSNIINASRQDDKTFAKFTGGNPYCFNLVHLNADAVRHNVEQKGFAYFKKRFNIGFWVWELDRFPEEWEESYRFFKEIWTPSRFCVETFTRHSSVPLFRVPHSVEINIEREYDRGHFKLPEGVFIFFFMFDFYSVIERKNPIALVESFKAAFGSSKDVMLLLKCTNSEKNPDARDELIKAAKGANVVQMDRYLDRDELYSLIKATDAYVSMHRSEGFGLTLAESMYLGKPVIATAYSGNTDFMDVNNSFPLRYKLVELERDYGPYKKGNHWAEADRDHAAETMRLVYEDRALGERIGREASDYIKRTLNEKVVGESINDRLSFLAGKYSMGEWPFK